MSNDSTNFILERWISSLPSRSKKHEDVLRNFSDLFSEMHDAGISFEEAHSTIRKAITAHFPSDYIAKFVYNKSNYKNKISFPEFLDSWKKETEAKANQAFYTYYELKHDSLPKESEKKYGNMSAQEYKLQRDHADSFPLLDLNEIRAKMKEIEDNLNGGNNG